MGLAQGAATWLQAGPQGEEEEEEEAQLGMETQLGTACGQGRCACWTRFHGATAVGTMRWAGRAMTSPGVGGGAGGWVLSSRWGFSDG